MNEIKQHEYDILSEIGQDLIVTQAGLTNTPGIAVGSVNWYIKRLIYRDCLKVSHLERTHLKYDPTPEGIAVFTQRALLYALDSLKVYSDFRRKAKVVVATLQQKGINQVCRVGENGDETLDMLRLTCIEAGIQLGQAPCDVVLRVDGQGIIKSPSRGNC